MKDFDWVGVCLMVLALSAVGFGIFAVERYHEREIACIRAGYTQVQNVGSDGHHWEARERTEEK